MSRRRAAFAGAAAALVWAALEPLDKKIFRNDYSDVAALLALALALAEHVALFPLSYLVDHKHPARGEPGVGRLFNGRGFAQATARHALFGALLGRLA